MEFIEMVEMLTRVNQESTNSVEDQILQQILAIVIKNPLDSDRGRCQEQIMVLLNQKRGD